MVDGSKRATSLDSFLHCSVGFSFKILHYTRNITTKRVTFWRVRLRDLAPGQHSCEETLQRWRAVCETLSDLTSPGIELQTFLTNSDVVNQYHMANWPFR